MIDPKESNYKKVLNQKNRFFRSDFYTLYEAENKGIQVNSYAKQIIVASESDDDRFIQTLSFEELETIRTADITSEVYNNARK